MIMRESLMMEELWKIMKDIKMKFNGMMYHKITWAIIRKKKKIYDLFHPKTGCLLSFSGM